MGRGDSFDVKPYISWPAISNQILVFVLVSTDIARNVVGRQRDVGMGISALSTANGVVKDHYSAIDTILTSVRSCAFGLEMEL